MFVILGYIIVIASVFGGFVMSGGHLAALVQPLELVMIGGAALGAFVVSNTGTVLMETLKATPDVFKGNRYTKKFYNQLLSMLFTLTTKIRKDGMISIEQDIDNPHGSELFKNFPLIHKDHHLVEFMCDYLRLMIAGSADFFQLENLMDNDIETHHHEGEIPVNALTRMADGMPAFGIVAAVMGVVHTMESIGLPPSELGSLVGKALVGTFLGILLGYGFIGPLAVRLEQRLHVSAKAFQCVKLVLLATVNNYPPKIAVEFGRKILFSTERPSNAQLEAMVKELKGK
jgi:chemotaxis protein MotA